MSPIFYKLPITNKVDEAYFAAVAARALRCDGVLEVAETLLGCTEGPGDALLLHGS